MDVFVIGIAGPSASGKSEFTRTVVRQFPESVTVLELDAYYRPLHEVADLKYQHDNPDAVDLAKARGHLQTLKRWEPVDSPIYDFTTHSTSSQTKRLEPRPIVIVEGLYLFRDDELRKELHHRIWLEADRQVLLDRRRFRDTRPPRNRTRVEIDGRFESDVWPAFEEFGRDCRRHADVQITNDDAQFGALEQALDELMKHPRLQEVLPTNARSVTVMRSPQP